MFRVDFRYRDEYSLDKWNEQGCAVCADNEQDAVNKAKQLYGLGIDCEYEIISVVEV